jgi:glycosyltransferase involved in cell wall biosynthesis
MKKYVEIKNGNIYIVSDRIIANKNCIELPKELENIPTKELIENYKFKNNSFQLKSQKIDPKDLKIAFITNWKMQCGLSSYAENLYSELKILIPNIKIFAEYNNSNDPDVIYCWKRGESLIPLINEVKKFDPDIVLFNHEFGLFPNARYWMSMMTNLSEYRIIAVMHSIFHHQDKIIVENSIPEIIVHLDEAKNVLKQEKQISSKVAVIPHGCIPCIDKSKLWNFYKSNYTFVQFGFLFRYKNFQNSIKAVSLLKSKYNNIFFTGLCSESPFAKLEHDIYYNELTDLINKLDIQENVSLIRGYQSDNVLNAYLRTNKAAIFPYFYDKDNECFGSSGAAPYAMSKNIPVISSSVNHFKNLPTIKADDPETIADELDKLFSNKNHYEEQLSKQNSHLELYSWKNIAKSFVDIFNE